MYSEMIQKKNVYTRVCVCVYILPMHAEPERVCEKERTW